MAAGQRLTICNRCIARAGAALRGGAQEAGGPRFERVGAGSRAACDSCGLPSKRVGALLRAAGVHVCDGCWRIAEQIVAAHPTPEPLGLEGLDE